MARLGNVFNNKEDIKKEEQHPRRMIKWIHYTKLKENPGQYCPERDKEEIEALADLIEAAGEVIQNANALAQIQELSQTEFNALNSEEVGKGVMVWGKKVVLFDAKISKENELYPLINTNFHEKAKEAEKKKQKQRQEQQESNDRIEEIILQMAELAPVTVRDLLSVLEITQEEAEKQLSFLCQQGYLIKSEEAGNILYQKAG